MNNTELYKTLDILKSQLAINKKILKILEFMMPSHTSSDLEELKSLLKTSQFELEELEKLTISDNK